MAALRTRRKLRGRLAAMACLALAALGGGASNGAADDAHGQLVTFTQAAPRAGAVALARRFFSPLAAAQIEGALARSPQLLGPPLDLAHERFLVFVPKTAPARGYGLFVFIPPWEDARLPAGWASVFEAQGIIFVTAARSGNAENVLQRRIPLALLAEFNVEQAWPIDRDRIFIGGFSGGSRVAMRVALAHADLFRGAILNAGADPVGERDSPLPPADVMRQAQERLRFVFVTGTRDEENRAADSASQEAMHRWCLLDLTERTPLDRGHEAASAADIGRAFLALAEPSPVRPEKLAACRAKVEARLTQQLDAVRALAAAGERARAQSRLQQIDQTFGGLSGQAVLELNAELTRLASGSTR